MKIFKSKHKLQKEILNIKNMSFVPTMGGLHKGHISLIKKTKTSKRPCLVSIYVNPLQFNRKKDFNSYPRNFKNDLKMLKKLKVSYVYLPTTKDIFGFKPKNKIFLRQNSNNLCGKFRKGHFKGVLNIVNRLLEIIRPRNIYLGVKDFQQLYLIKEHIKKKKIQTNVISCKIIREKNGIACSTRNSKISKNKLIIASKIFYFLKNKKKLIKKDYINFNYINFKKEIIKLGAEKIDYIEIYNIDEFKKAQNNKKKFRIFIAYYLDKIRLIDNI
jgi:pantoate--beta-alanine ligase